MTPDLRSSAVDLLASIATPERVREQARALGVVKRQGKVDAYALLMVVVLGLVVRGRTSIAQLGHVYGDVTGCRLARSSFSDRLTPSFSKLISRLLDSVVSLARSTPPRPPGVLACFTDVLAADSSVVKVHDSLRGVWKGTRHNSAKAALKVHTWVRVLTGELVKYRLTAEAFGDSRAFGVEHSLRGVLMLFDRGYASPSLWRRIDSVGGYFLTRIPKGWNQVIDSENRRHRGRARPLAGKRLREALAGLKREVVDVNVTFRCRVRGYRGGRARMVDQVFRVVALRRPNGQYALYATNAPSHKLAAEDVWNVYRLRWEVETFYKTAKSWCALSETPSRTRHRVETLVYAALLRATLAMRAKAQFLRLAPARNRLHVNPHQWMRWWNRMLHLFLDDLVPGDAHLTLDDLLLNLCDPNRTRVPSRVLFAMAE